LSWSAKITLNGPDRGGKIRGVKKMLVGFVQNLTCFENSGTYALGSKLVSNVAASTVRPVLDAAPAIPAAWYLTGGANETFENANPNEPGGNVAEIFDSDTPFDGPPLTAGMRPTVGPNDELLTSMTLRYDFVLDVCVQTKDTQQHADSVYTRRATAQWSFNGSGTIGAGPAYPWTSNGAGVTAPAGWTDVEDASQPRALGGDRLNTLLQAEAFHAP